MSLSPIKFNLLTLNVRGLRKHSKWKKTISWLESNNMKNSICFLQESHSDVAIERKWRNSWSGRCYFSHGTTASCGVATLIGKNIDSIMKDKIIDVHGRNIIISCEIQGMSCILANTYAPNKEKEQVIFFTEINNIISSINEDNVSVLWGGDFNYCMSTKDTDGGNYTPKQRTNAIMNIIMEELELCDIWRIQNINVHQYTWRTSNPLVQRRLDFYLISKNLQSAVSKVDIICAPFSDHSAVVLSINTSGNSAYGPSHWRFNTSILENTEYCNNIRNMYGGWKTEYQNREDFKRLWEFLKFKIREYTIKRLKRKG